MRLSSAVFKTVIAVSLTIAALTAATLPFVDRGTGSWEIGVLTLVVTAITVAIAALGLYLRWDPFRPFEEP